MPSLDPLTLTCWPRWHARRDCTEAKEALSADTEVTIPVLLPQLHPGAHGSLGVRGHGPRLARGHRRRSSPCPRVRRHSRARRRLGALVGGSSRIPLVAQLLSAEFGRPIAVDADPKASIALGAARMAAARGLVPVPVNGSAVAMPDHNGYNGHNGHGEHDHQDDADDEDERHPAQRDRHPARRTGRPGPIPLRQRIRRVPALAVLALIAIVVTAGAAFATRLTLEPESANVPAPLSTPSAPTVGDGNPGGTGPAAAEQPAAEIKNVHERCRGHRWSAVIAGGHPALAAEVRRPRRPAIRGRRRSGPGPSNEQPAPPTDPGDGGSRRRPIRRPRQPRAGAWTDSPTRRSIRNPRRRSSPRRHRRRNHPPRTRRPDRWAPR